MYTLPDDSIAGSISFTQYLDITKDIVISFDYACYGTDANGGEGFCVYFSDTFNPIVQGGGPGPGLAYSSIKNVDNIPANVDTNGLTSGLLGVGFDITGNFGSNAYFDSGNDDIVPNSIVLRSNYANKFDFITRTSNLNDQSFTRKINLYQQLTGGQDPSYNRVRVRLTDFGQRIVVDIKPVDSLNFTNYLNYTFTNYNNSLLSSTSLSAFPVFFTPTVRCGLGFATGNPTNTTFKIKNFNFNGIFTLSAATGFYTYDVDTATLSGSLAYTYPTAPYFNTYDQMGVVDTYDGTNRYPPGTTNPALTTNPLIIADPLGAPFIPGNQYIKITKHN
jgi:hypothetical protein